MTRRAFSTLAPILALTMVLAGCATIHRHTTAAQAATQITPAVAVAQESPAEDSADEAASFYLLKRTGGAELPVERMLEARRHAHTMPLYSLASRSFVRRGSVGASAHDLAIGTWQPLGPGNIGGRTLALAIRPDDPNTMYAGSAGGGVWKTTDGGQSWNPLTDLLPSLAITTLAMDPQNPDTLYAGTGEWYTNSQRGDSIRGAGIFKTTDGGATWNQLPGTVSAAVTNNFYYVNKIIVSPNNSQHVYAAAWGGIWVSLDGGVTWRRALNRSGSLFGCQDLAIRTDQTRDYLFAGCSWTGVTNTPGVYRNTDAAGSGTWDLVFTAENLQRISLAIAPSSQSVVYAAASSSESGNLNALLGVYRSTTNGDPDTWTTQVSGHDANPLNSVLFTNPRSFFADVCTGGTSTKDHQGNYDNVIAVDPTNADTVWVGGIDLFRSDDGGKNWGMASFWQVNGPQMAHADHHALVFAPGYNGADNQTLLTANDGGVYRTDNALAATATGARAACAPYTTAIKWTNINNGYAVTQFYHGSVYPGAGAYVGGTQDNGTLRGSAATGPGWTTMFGGDGGFTAIDFTDPNVWYGETQHLALEKTTNGGLSFSSALRGITDPSDRFLFIIPFVMDPSQAKRLYLGGTTLWRTTDGAQNWLAASSALPAANGIISAIAVFPSDPNRVAFGTSTGYVHTSNTALSADKGTTWPSLQPRPGYVSRVVFDPVNPDTIYATYSQYKQSTAQSHVYRSSDGGLTWVGIDGTGSTGLPDIPVFSIVPDPQNTSTLYLGTDIGLFVSQDNGTTWAADQNPFADTVVETLTLDRSAGQTALIAFTHGRGVWKTILPGSGDACQYSLSADSVTFPAFGGTFPVGVKTGDNCAWSALPGRGFTIGSPAGGKGNGTFTVAATTNNTAQPKAATFFVLDKTLTATQDAALSAQGNDGVSSPFALRTLPAVAIQDTSSATGASDDPVHSCTKSADDKSVWFSVTAPSTGTMHLQFESFRADNGADSGAVMTVYPLVGGVAGAELGCSLISQAATGSHFAFREMPVQQGATYLVEVSATLSGAPAGAKLMGGNVTLEASMK